MDKFFLLKMLQLKQAIDNDNSDDTYFENIDDVTNHKIGDDKLIDICTK